MASSLVRLHALVTFLRSRFKYWGILLAFLYRKLTTYRLWYCRSPIVSQKPNPSQPFCAFEPPPLGGSLDLKGLTEHDAGTRTFAVAASHVPLPGQINLSPYQGPSIQFPSPSHSNPTSSMNSSRGHTPTSPPSGTVTPSPGGNIPLLNLPFPLPIPFPLPTPPTTGVSSHIIPVSLMNPENVADSRYTRQSTTSRDMVPQMIEPLTTAFPYFQGPEASMRGYVDGKFGPWEPATHPEGALYFYDEARRLFTDTDMCDKILRDEAEHFYSHLQTFPEAKHLAISGDYDLVLDIKQTKNLGFQWSYYYVSHSNQCIFWLKENDISPIVAGVGSQSLAHIKHQLKYLYWFHWSLYPVNFDQHRLPEAAYDELIGMLGYGCIDAMTSKTSTLWLDSDQMQRMITLVKDAKMASASQVFYTAGAARLLSLFTQWRFIDFHGQHNARLNRQNTVYNEPRRSRSIVIIVLSPLLFLAPRRYLTELEEAWIDEHILAPVWKDLMTKMLGEWGDLILWSTVMLSVNVGFLAIPGIVPNGGTAPFIAISNQIPNYLSLMASVGSIVIGLLLVRHHRTRIEEDPNGASRYLYQNDHRYCGLEPMAIVFSLPWALLMWAMVLFSTEFLYLCFRQTNLQIHVPLGLMSAFVAIPILWCIWNSWRSRLFDTDLKI